MTLIALFIWPIISVVLFRTMGPAKGMIWAILIGTLFLPENYALDLPGLPPLDKNMAIAIGALLGFFITRDALTDHNIDNVADPKAKRIIFGCAGFLLASSFLTVLNNGEFLRFGPFVMQALGVRDMITMTAQVIVLIIPYFLAQRLLASEEHHVMLIKAFVMIGLFYSLLVLIEIRMAPQLHIWIYGYFQHGWDQHVRGGHFRPIVFMPHGLSIGILLVTCAMCAFIILKHRVAAGQSRILYLFAGFWFLAVLAVSRNFGATSLAMLFIPILWFFGQRLQLLVAVVVATAFISFPVLRQTHVVTYERTLEIVGDISLERQQSLQHRVDNETAHLDRAAIKPLTGWGIWARWRIRDPITGEDISTSDGRWISVLGERGWIGFIGYFGLLTGPIFLLRRTRKRQALNQSTTGIALIMATTIVYQVPNNTVGPLMMILAGALAGYTFRRSPDQASEDQMPAKASRSATAYTRFPAHSNAQ